METNAEGMNAGPPSLGTESPTDLPAAASSTDQPNTSSTPPVDRPSTPKQADAERPVPDRQESSHEYSATGLDATPRSPFRGRHSKTPSRQKNALNTASSSEANSPTFAKVVANGISSEYPSVVGDTTANSEEQKAKQEHPGIEYNATSDPTPDEAAHPRNERHATTGRPNGVPGTREDRESRVAEVGGTPAATTLAADGSAPTYAQVTQTDNATRAVTTKPHEARDGVEPARGTNGYDHVKNGFGNANAQTIRQRSTRGSGGQQSAKTSSDTQARPDEDGNSKWLEKEGMPPLRDAMDGVSDGRDQDKNRAYQAGGIRFAPWNVPYQRRLQTLAVLWHSVTIGVCLALFWFLCAIPLMWPLLFWYLVHLSFSTDGSNGSLHRRSPWLRGARLWRWFADYFPARLHKTHDLVPTRKYIFGYHPHGIISHGAWVAFGTEALGFADLFPGVTNTLVTLESNFRTPIYRDYVLAMGLQSVSKESITNILTKGGRNGEGMGRAVTIVVGGARESLSAQPGQMQLVLRSRKGFVKLALRTGADLVPVVAFGENDLYNQLQADTHPRLHRLQMWILRVAKFTLPFLHGRGIFNYDVGLMPYRRPLNIVVGRPIAVAQAAGPEVSAAEVDRLHDLYCRQVVELWDEYKDRFARDRKEEIEFVG